MKGLFANMWDNKESVVGGLFDMFDAPKKEAELGADLDYGLLAQNFAPDIKETGEEIKTMITNPRETVKAIADVAGGAYRTGLSKVMPKGVMDFLGKVDEMTGYDSVHASKVATDSWQDIVSTHGTLQGFKKFAQENPFEAMLELTGAGLVARQVKNVTAPVVIKAIKEAELATTKVMMETENLATTLNEFNPSPLPMVGARPIRSEEMRGNVDPQFVSGQPVGGKNQVAIDAANNVTRTVVGQAEDLITPKQVSVKDFVGRWLLFTQSDRTDAGGNIVDVNGIPMNVKQWGGNRYQLLNSSVAKEDLWSSDPKVLNLISQASETIKARSGQYPLLSEFDMQPTGSNFSHMTQEVMMAALNATLNKTQKLKINKELKALDPNFPGIEADNMANVLSKMSGEKRKMMNNILGRVEYSKDGLSMAQVGVAISDASKLNSKRGTVNYLGEIEPSLANRVQGGSLHPSYPDVFKGHNVGQFKEKLTVFDFLAENPWALSYIPEANKKPTKKNPTGSGSMQRVKRGTGEGKAPYDPTNPTGDDFRSLDLQPPIQSAVQITDTLLRNFERKGLL